MNFDLSDEQLMLRDGAQRFVREQYGFEHRRQLSQSEHGYSRDYWKRYADMGWLGLDLPEDVGGLGLGAVDTTVLFEQLGRGMVLEPLLATAVIGAWIINRCGNEALRAALLPGLIGGEVLVSLAHDECGSRGCSSNLPNTEATLTGQGTYRVSGSKTLVLAAPTADRFIVSARSSTHGELLLLLIDREVSGLSLQAYPLVDGSRAGDVHLRDVEVPATGVLASGLVAESVLTEALDRARMAAMALALGAMEACLEVTSDYIKNRVQFKQPLAKFQSLQHLMADMFVDTVESRSMLYRGLAMLDAPAAARHKAVSAAKIVIGPAGRRVSASGLQLHGGYGVTDEYVISHYFRYLFVLEKLFGTADDHLRDYVLE